MEIFFLLLMLSTYQVGGYIVDNVNGDDNNSGEDVDNAFKTIARCVESLQNPGDECQIRAGHHYREVVTVSGLRGTEEQPIRIVGYQDERPIMDGTVAIQPNNWNFDQNTGICSSEIDKDIFALFYRNELMVPARWPNAKWSDKTVFDSQYWRPEGCCLGSELGYMIDDALAEANLNFTGAMAILNVGSWETWVREVLSYDLGSNRFTYSDDFADDVVKYRDKHLMYFIESKFELLDAPEEWFYDKNTQVLYLIMPEGAGECPEIDQTVLKGRVLDNAFEIIDSAYVTIADISFWASNVIASDESNNGITFDSLIFEYPSSSHRMLHDDAYPKHTELNGNNNAVVNCSFHHSEGPALVYEGKNMLVTNNEFILNDWVGQGNYGTISDAAKPGEISHNTFRYNGDNRACDDKGRNTQFIWNHVEAQCWGFIKNDGAALQVPSPGAIDGVYISNNWIHDSPKKGIRFDGSGDPMCVNGYVGYNVVWNIVGNIEIFPKGDNHTVVNNVAWDDSDQEGCTLCMPSSWTSNGSNVTIPMNTNSVLVNNGASKFLDGGGVVENNYESQDVKEQMVDSANFDFRPIAGGAFITPDGGEIIGAYTSGETSLTYWMPGRRLYKTSFPIPSDGATVTASERKDVICQIGYLADQHDFYFGDNFDNVDSAGKDDDTFQMTLNGEENIFSLPALTPDTVYYWRVDARRGDDVFKGDTWSFGAI